MTFYNVVLELSYAFVPQLAVEVLCTKIERGDAEEQVPASGEVFLRKGEQWRANATSAFAFHDGDGGDVRRTRQPVREEQDESQAPPAFPRNE